jgi:hypothetical protein
VVAVIASGHPEGDGIVLPDISQRSKERIAMAGQTHVARLSGERSPGDMTDTAAQRGFASLPE